MIDIPIWLLVLLIIFIGVLCFISLFVIVGYNEYEHENYLLKIKMNHLLYQQETKNNHDSNDKKYLQERLDLIKERENYPIYTQLKYRVYESCDTQFTIYKDGIEQEKHPKEYILEKVKSYEDNYKCYLEDNNLYLYQKEIEHEKNIVYTKESK